MSEFPKISLIKFLLEGYNFRQNYKLTSTLEAGISYVFISIATPITAPFPRPVLPR